MKLSDKFIKYCLFVLISFILALIVFTSIRSRQDNNRITELQNMLAVMDKTVETQKNVYEKLSLSLRDVSNILSENDKTIASLIELIDKKDEDILTATSIALKWKSAYEAKIAGRQTDIPVETNNTIIPVGTVLIRKKVEFEKDFGYIGVKGWTITDPPEAYINVRQNKPLNINLVVTQDKNKRWHTYATSSEENVGIDIRVAAVNPWVLKSKWYEFIQVDTSIAGAQSDTGPAALLGIGASYKIGKFNVGPATWLTLADRTEQYYGVNFSWRPFQKD